MSKTLPKRTEIDPAFTWNAPSLFASTDAWETEFAAVDALAPQVVTYKGTLHTGSEAVTQAYGFILPLFARAEKLVIYAGMGYSCDTTDQAMGALYNRANSLMSRLRANASYLEPELLAIGQPTLQAWQQADPHLATFGHYVDDLFRRRAHVRSAEVEEVLGQAGDVFGQINMTGSMMANADLKFAQVHTSDGSADLGQGTIGSLLVDPDRETRRQAWENYADGYLSLQHSLASNLTASIKRDVFLAQAHGYSSALEAALAPHNISLEVFHNLIATFKRHIPVWHRYFEIRKRALGTPDLHPYDVWAPLSRREPHIPFAQAVEWIAAGLAPLGEDYVTTLRRGCLEQRWVDIYPNAGKRQGAFSWGAQGTHPFIMMSYSDDMKSLSTLAHELGHSMHSYYTWQTQPALYTDYSLFVAEVASNFNQAMVRAHLLQTNPDPEFQIALLDEAISSNLHRYFLIMPTLARFELEMHTRVEQGGSATASDMTAFTAQSFAEAYGPAMHIDAQRLGITWAQFNHLYTGYYVFQYATGIAGAHALAQGILDGKPDAVANYRGFLKAGNADYPLEVLKRAGVDLTTPEPVEKTFAILSGYIDRMEQLIAAR